MTQRDTRVPEGNVPGVGLAAAFGVLAAALVAFAGWEYGLRPSGVVAGAAVLGGVAAFFLGVRSGIARGARARESLRETLVAVEAQLVRAQLTALRGTSGASEEELAEERALRASAEAALANAQRASQVSEEEMRTTLYDVERREQASREQMEAALAEARRALADERRQALAWKEQADRARREIERLGTEARSRQSDEKGALREVERLLSPYIEREKLLLDLARIDGVTRGGLPDLLDTIAKKAHFASIVLSDESGLPVAASRGTRDPESVAATSSLLFTLADRVAQTGAPAPIAVLVHDEANETILHRLFRVDGGRFLLTATGRGNRVMPETLDPTLHSIERALLRQPLHA